MQSAKSPVRTAQNDMALAVRTVHSVCQIKLCDSYGFVIRVACISEVASELWLTVDDFRDGVETKCSGDVGDEADGDREVLLSSIHADVLPGFYRLRSNFCEKSFIISWSGHKYAILVLWE